ncbi:hypothetical protein SPAR_11107 [Streptomyces sparsogenes DSM 40356]|uniref:Lipoprotein n=2 Tax=Streptomyces sparsogenes TaxID=67365 RepID=A0A1R1SM84_9ACTN|nr:hypothetical protein SPAR_11107 [Streptomyces sparsogenes DSM 40356]
MSRVSVGVLMGALVGLLAACGGDSEGRQGEAGPGRATRALSEGELDRAALTASEAEGFSVERVDAETIEFATREAADKPACQPLAEASALVAYGPKAKAEAYRVYKATKDDLSVHGITAHLMSYGEDEAKAKLRRVRAAVKACSGGFAVGGDGEDGVRYSAIRPLAGVEAGSEVVAYRLAVELPGGRSMPHTYVVARSGPLVVAYEGVDAVRSKAVDVPEAMVVRQIAKLEKTAS